MTSWEALAANLALVRTVFNRASPPSPSSTHAPDTAIATAVNQKPASSTPIRIGDQAQRQRADAVAEVSPESIDAQAGATPVRVRNVADGCDQRRIEQRHTDTGECRRHRPCKRDPQRTASRARRPRKVHMPDTIGHLRQSLVGKRARPQLAAAPDEAVNADDPANVDQRQGPLHAGKTGKEHPHERVDELLDTASLRERGESAMSDRYTSEKTSIEDGRSRICRPGNPRPLLCAGLDVRPTRHEPRPECHFAGTDCAASSASEDDTSDRTRTGWSARSNSARQVSRHQSRERDAAVTRELVETRSRNPRWSRARTMSSLLVTVIDHANPWLTTEQYVRSDYPVPGRRIEEDEGYRQSRTSQPQDQYLASARPVPTRGRRRNSSHL